MPRSSGGGGAVRNYNYYSAPPIVSPYGYGFPMFGGGFGMGVYPVFGIGSLFNVMLLMFFLNIAFQVVRGITNGTNNDSGMGGKKRDDDSDDERW